VEIDEAFQAHAVMDRLRMKNAACVNALKHNDKPTAGQSRRLSLLSCTPNWASSRDFPPHIFLHRLSVDKRDVARESARCRSMAQTIGVDMSVTLRRRT
jgi:hypothetical protein